MPQPDLPPIHPGEELREEFMLPLGLSPDRLAKEIDVPVILVQAILDESRAITGEIALRLSRYFSTTPQFWLNMQRDYELEHARIAVGDKILNTVNPRGWPANKRPSESLGGERRTTGGSFYHPAAWPSFRESEPAR